MHSQLQYFPEADVFGQSSTLMVLWQQARFDTKEFGAHNGANKGVQVALSRVKLPRLQR
jgi:hypothetical protein